MNQKIKCFFGFHKERVLGSELPYYQRVLLKCDCCGKYKLWHTGIMCETPWTKDINKFPKEIRDHIIKNNL